MCTEVALHMEVAAFHKTGIVSGNLGVVFRTAELAH